MVIRASTSLNSIYKKELPTALKLDGPLYNPQFEGEPLPEQWVSRHVLDAETEKKLCSGEWLLEYLNLEEVPLKGCPVGISQNRIRKRYRSQWLQ